MKINKTVAPPSIMGILNITPDSFSDGGLFDKPENVLERFSELYAHGVDIIDIGAESTGPNSVPITSEIEIERLSRLFNHPDFLNYRDKVEISTDTYKSEVAAYAIANGAGIVNDISALRFDSEMASLVSNHKAKVILMFSKEDGNSPNVSSTQKHFDSIIDAISEFFNERVSYAVKNGISESNIILDPGMGAFLGKDPKYSWEVVNKFSILKERFPSFQFLCGVSRKSFISSVVDSTATDLASKIIELELISQGLDIVRTHDVDTLKKLLPLLIARRTI